MVVGRGENSLLGGPGSELRLSIYAVGRGKETENMRRSMDGLRESK